MPPSTNDHADPEEPGSLLIVMSSHPHWLGTRLALVFGLGVLVGMVLGLLVGWGLR